jgi:hypothetical protein
LSTTAPFVETILWIFASNAKLTKRRLPAKVILNNIFDFF